MSLIQARGYDLGHVASGSIPIAATTVGSAVIIALFGLTGGNTFTSVQAGSGSLITSPDCQVASAGNGPAAVFSIPAANVATGTTAINIVQSAAEWTCAIVVEESNLAASPFDQKATQNQGGTANFDSGPVTTTQALEVAYAFFMLGINTDTVTPGSATDTAWAQLSGTGLTNGQAQESTGGIAIFGERKALSSVGTYNGVATCTVNESPTSIIVTYKVAAGGGGVPIAARRRMEGGMSGMGGGMMARAHRDVPAYLHRNWCQRSGGRIFLPS